MLDAITARVVINSAWRSRWTICVESVAGFNPSRRRLISVKTPEETVMSGKHVFRCLSIAAALITVATADQAYAQRGRGMMGPQGVNPLQVAGIEGVQKELGLSQEKIDKIKDLSNDVREDYMAEIAGSGINPGDLNDLSKEEAAKRRAEMATKMAEVTKKINAKYMPKLSEVLDKKEMTRLREIAIQVAGGSAFQDEEIAKELALTTDQKDKIKKLGTEYQGKMRELFTSGADRSEMQTKMAEMRKEQTEKTNEVLTKEQREKFDKMKGAPVDVAKLRPAGGRRRNN